MLCMEQYVTEVSAVRTGQPATGCFGSDTEWIKWRKQHE